MKTIMTLRAYDELCDRIASNEYQCGYWWPSVEDIKKYIEPNPEKYLEFMIWITETATQPTTQAEKESRNLLNRLLNQVIKIKDGDEKYTEKR